MSTITDDAGAPGSLRGRTPGLVRELSVFFPCYDDEASIGSVVGAAADVLDRFGIDGEIIVVNDGSSDGSAVVLDQLARDEPRLRIVTHETNRGYGGALRSGFGAASKEWVFYTDGDGQYDPANLERLLAVADDEADVVQGYKLGRSDNLARRLIGRIYHRTVSFLFGLEVRDTDCDFRLIRRSALDRIQLEKSSGVICVELVRKLQMTGARFVEVGVEHHPRLHGRSRFFRIGNLMRTFRDLGVLYRDLVLVPFHARHKRALFGLLAVPNVWTLTFLTALRRPVGRADEAWFLWVAARANSGRSLYRGVYYVSTPLAMWTMQLMARVFGTHIAVERALAATCFTGSLVLVWLIARHVQIGPRGRALLVAAIFLYGSPLAHFGSIYSLLAVTCTLGAVLASLHAIDDRGAVRSRWAALLAGLAAGAAFATKPNVGLLALVAAVVTITFGVRRISGTWRAASRAVATAAAGFAAIVVAMMVPLLVNGSAGSMIGDVFLGKGNAYFAIEGRQFAPGFWASFSFLTGSQSPLGQLFFRTGNLAPLLAIVLTALALIRARHRVPSDVVALLAFGVVGLGAAAPDFGPQHITEALPLLLTLPVLAYARAPRPAPRPRAIPARLRARWCRPPRSRS